MSTVPLRTDQPRAQADAFQETQLNQPLGRAGILGLAVFFVLLAMIAVVFLIGLWPSPSANAPQTPFYLFPGFAPNPPREVRIALIALLSGALGSLLHVTASFTSYVGNRQLIRSWVLWYVLRPISGMVLALLVYFLIRAGFFPPGTQGDVISPYGVAGICGLLGMFSKQATDKLKEVFDHLFSPKEDANRVDKLAGGTSATTAATTTITTSTTSAPTARNP